MSIFGGVNNPGVELNQFTTAEHTALVQLASLGDPNADRIVFWDDSAGSYAYLTVGTNLTITDTTLDASGGGTPGGADTQVQFNDGGSFGGDSAFTFNKTTNVLTIEDISGVSGTVFSITTPDSNTNTEITIESGSAVSGNTNGGNLFLLSGVGFGSGAGGAFSFAAGDGGATGDGGALNLSGGSGGMTSGAGGSIALEAGSADGSGNGGSVTITSGEAVGGTNGRITLSQMGGVYDFASGNAGIEGILNFNSVNTSDKTFTFPNTTGTIALTTSTVAVATAITVANEATDTTCFPLFVTAATGDLGAKSNAGLTFNSNTGVLTATGFAGPLTGNVTGNASGSAATVTSAAQTAITTLANLVSVQGLTLTLADAGADAILGWDDSAAAYENLTQAEVLSVIGDSSATAKGVVELATDAETVTGTDTARATTPANITAKMAAPGTIGSTTPGNITGLVITANTSFMPDANDGAVLGAAGTAFSDLFLAEGGVINWDSSDVTLTQTGNILAVAGGDFRIATADVGTNADSVPTLSSTSTLTNKTLTSPTLTTPSAFTTGGVITLAENTSIALDPAGSADGKYTGITVAGTAGATLAFGDLVYLAVADSRWELADADAASTSGDVMLGICVLAAASDGDPTVLLLHGVVRADAAFPALTIGAPAYVGTTAGDIQVAQPSGADDVIRRVGFATTADEIYFKPSDDYVTHI